MSGPRDLQAGDRARTGRRLFWLSFFVAAIAVIFGWSAAENAADLRTCELAIGAINDSGDRIDIRRVSASSFARVVRIDYDVTPSGFRRPVNRFVSCQFSASPRPPYATILSSIDTEEGALPDSKFYLLHRFYLDTNEAKSVAIPFAQNTSSGATNIATHALEWLVSVLSKAAIYSLLASLFLCFSGLYRSDTPGRGFYAGIAGLLTMVGSIVATGAFVPITIILAVVAGLVALVCFRLVTGEELRLAARTPDTPMVRWIAFSAMLGLALFWFPTHGLLFGYWTPARLFQPLPLFILGGYGVSTTPLAVLLIVAAGVCAFLIPKPGRSLDKPSAFLRHGGLILIPVLAGLVMALGFVQYGLALNPFLLCTKAALIALIVLTLTENDRHLTIIPVSLAVVSLEYAGAPFFDGGLIDAASYMVLVAVLFLLMQKKLTVSRES